MMRLGTLDGVTAARASNVAVHSEDLDLEVAGTTILADIVGQHTGHLISLQFYLLCRSENVRESFEDRKMHILSWKTIRLTQFFECCEDVRQRAGEVVECEIQMLQQREIQPLFGHHPSEEGVVPSLERNKGRHVEEFIREFAAHFRVADP